MVTLPADPAGAFQLHGQLDHAVAPLAATVNGQSVTLTIGPGSTVEHNSLTDAPYRLTVLTLKVNSGDLDANSDWTDGDNAVFVGFPTNSLFRLFGHADGNGTVNFADFTAQRLTFGGWSSIFDNANGVGTLDFNQFRVPFGSSV